MGWSRLLPGGRVVVAARAAILGKVAIGESAQLQPLAGGGAEAVKPLAGLEAQRGAELLGRRIGGEMLDHRGLELRFVALGRAATIAEVIGQVGLAFAVSRLLIERQSRAQGPDLLDQHPALPVFEALWPPSAWRTASVARSVLSVVCPSAWLACKRRLRPIAVDARRRY